MRKRSNHLVDKEDDEIQHATEPQMEDDEYNLQRGIQMSLEYILTNGQAPFSGVAIREPASESTRKLPIIEGNGKGIATDEQATQSLLDLQKPKKQNAKTSADTEKSNSEADTEIMNVVYPQVHKSLKLTTKEHVYIENPPSLSRTLSSMKNLYDAFTFGDQFLNDKSPKDEPGKTNVETEVESTVTVTIHQASSPTHPLSTPIIDLTPPKPVSHPEHIALYDALELFMDRKNKEEFKEATTNSSKQKSPSTSKNHVDDVPIPNDVHLSKLEDTDAANFPKIKTRPGLLKPIPEEETPETP
nr:hypothetical protein [Tanacetum cinerariifolium]